jgi:hypothetical protein
MQSEVKYLGLHLDRRLTWSTHIRTKRRHLELKLRGMYWLLGRKSKLSLENKLLLYKCILKPAWSYGIQLWGVCEAVPHENHSTTAIKNTTMYYQRTAVRSEPYVAQWPAHPIRRHGNQQILKTLPSAFSRTPEPHHRWNDRPAH